MKTGAVDDDQLAGAWRDRVIVFSIPFLILAASLTGRSATSMEWPVDGDDRLLALTANRAAEALTLPLRTSVFTAETLTPNSLDSSLDFRLCAA